jgi:lipopolysaccharide export system permease protein
MRLLDRYLLRELLLPLGYCLGGFLICFIAFDLFSNLAEFQREKLSGLDIAAYYVNRTPEFLVASYVTPMSLLLSLLYALTNHARHNELTAMRAAAIPLWRIAAPYLAVGILFSAAMLYLNEEVLPEASEQAENIRRRGASAADQPKAATRVIRYGVFFVNPVDQRTWRIGAYHLTRNIMAGPHLDWRLSNDWRVTLFAERAEWTERRWQFTNAEQLIFSPLFGGSPVVLKHSLLSFPQTNRFVFTHSNTIAVIGSNQLALPIIAVADSNAPLVTNDLVLPALTERPRLIRSEIKISAINDFRSLRKAQLSSAEILDFLRLHPQLDRVRTNALLTLFHSRMAVPWICVVVVLIAVPFGALPGRRNVFVGVASSIFICFLFLIVRDLTLALGSGGHLAPWLAAWLPNIIFALAGAVLLWRVR